MAVIRTGAIRCSIRLFCSPVAFRVVWLRVLYADGLPRSARNGRVDFPDNLLDSRFTRRLYTEEAFRGPGWRDVLAFCRLRVDLCVQYCISAAIAARLERSSSNLAPCQVGPLPWKRILFMRSSLPVFIFLNLLLQASIRLCYNSLCDCVL